MFPWRFQAQDGAIFEVPVSGSLIVNHIELIREPVRAGVVIAYVPRGYVAESLAQGVVVPLLQEWTLRESSFFLYYPSRRQTSAALKALIDFLRAPVGK
jgi:DNA-binding transcriptional LysR family regulator